MAKKSLDLYRMFEPAQTIPILETRRGRRLYNLDVRQWDFKDPTQHLDATKRARDFQYKLNEGLRTLSMSAEDQLMTTQPVSCRRDKWDVLPKEYEDRIVALIKQRSADKVDENPRILLRDYFAVLFNRLHNQPYNALLHEQVACLLQSVANAKSGDEALPRDLTRAFGAGKYGVVSEGDFRSAYSPLRPRGGDPAFLIKTEIPSRSSSMTSLNETVIGMHAMNYLKRVIPNFVFIYGSFMAPSLSNPQGKNVLEGDVKLFAKPVDTARYIMVQFVKKAVTLYDWLDANERSRGFAVACQEIYSQIVLSLAVAQERYDFSHNDLHGYNILVTQLKERHTIAYPMLSGKTVYLETGYLVTIIDYGYAHANIPVTREVARRVSALRAPGVPEQVQLVTTSQKGRGREATYTLHAGIWRTYLGITPMAGNSLADAMRLTLNFGRKPIETFLGGWTRLFFKGQDPKYSYFSDFERHITNVPGVTINLLEFYLAGLDEAAAYADGSGLVVSINHLPDHFGPLLSCESLPCTRDPILEGYLK